MGFLQNIFKRKPGGTVVGNLLRGAVKSVPVVGNLLGNGAMMITQVDADKRDLSDADFEAKYNALKASVSSDGSIAAYLRETAGAALQGATAAVQAYQNQTGNVLPKTGTLETGAIKSWIGQNIYKFVGGIAAGIALIWYIVKRKR